jgi:hypothetical protein
MANDLYLIFHGSASGGTTLTATTATNLPSIDLGSNSVNRTLLLERRVTALTGAAGINVKLQASTDNTTFSDMPGAGSSLAGFPVATTTIYGSTDAVAANAPDRIAVRTDKRYVRAVVTPGTTFTTVTFSVVGKVLSGAYASAVGPLDV